MKFKIAIFSLSLLVAAMLLQVLPAIAQTSTPDTHYPVPVPEKQPTPPPNVSYPQVQDNTWNPVTMIALASMVISLASSGWMIWGTRRAATNDYVEDLEHRIEALEKELEAAESRIGTLERENAAQLRENIELLRRLAQAPDKQP